MQKSSAASWGVSKGLWGGWATAPAAACSLMGHGKGALSELTLAAASSHWFLVGPTAVGPLLGTRLEVSLGVLGELRLASNELAGDKPPFGSKLQASPGGGGFVSPDREESKRKALGSGCSIFDAFAVPCPGCPSCLFRWGATWIQVRGEELRSSPILEIAPLGPFGAPASLNWG
jgi:hypothetical protein